MFWAKLLSHNKIVMKQQKREDMYIYTEMCVYIYLHIFIYMWREKHEYELATSCLWIRSLSMVRMLSFSKLIY